MRTEIRETRQQKAYEKAIAEIAKYESPTELRKENVALYLFLRKHGLLHLMPKGSKITKLSHTNQELIDMSEEYEDYKSLRDGNPNLLRALKTRGILPEHLTYVPPTKRPKPEPKSKQQPKPQKETPVEPEDPYLNIVPKEFLKGNRKGPYACFRAVPTPTGYLCGRCRHEFPKGKHHRLCSDLCQSCYNAKVLADRDPSVELNICGNIKDEYCHIVLKLPDGPMYIGIEVTDEEKRRLLLAGYAFLIK